MAKKLWVVAGFTGEFEDKSDWIITTYTRKRDAELHVKLATDWYNANGGVEIRKSLKSIVNPFDPGMLIDYTGTTWSCYPITLSNSSELKKLRQKHGMDQRKVAASAKGDELDT